MSEAPSSLAYPSLTAKASTTCQQESKVESDQHTSFILHATGPDVHEELDDRISRRQDFIEQNEANNVWPFSVKSKVRKERLVFDKYREEREHIE